jgi:hypothetical protein
MKGKEKQLSLDLEVEKTSKKKKPSKEGQLHEYNSRLFYGKLGQLSSVLNETKEEDT